jgi:hypothetical protein
VTALVLLQLTSLSVASARRTPQSAAPSQAEINRALEAVKADPNLAAEQTIKTLRWNEGPARKRRPVPAWMTWIGGLFGWLEQSARVLIWLVAAGLVGLLIVYLLRIARAARAAADDAAFVAPTHVRDLDIRPETLPDDIGHAARALWDRGEHRAALALLYRGLLSRLAHVHRLPIRDSTTEGDCLALAATHLANRRRRQRSMPSATASPGRSTIRRHRSRPQESHREAGPAVDRCPGQHCGDRNLGRRQHALGRPERADAAQG